MKLALIESKNKAGQSGVPIWWKNLPGSVLAECFLHVRVLYCGAHTKSSWVLLTANSFQRRSEGEKHYHKAEENIARMSRRWKPLFKKVLADFAVCTVRKLDWWRNCLALCDEMFCHYPLCDENLRHISRALQLRHQSNTAKSTSTFLAVCDWWRYYKAVCDV